VVLDPCTRLETEKPHAERAGVEQRILVAPVLLPLVFRLDLPLDLIQVKVGGQAAEPFLGIVAPVAHAANLFFIAYVGHAFSPPPPVTMTGAGYLLFYPARGTGQTAGSGGRLRALSGQTSVKSTAHWPRAYATMKKSAALICPILFLETAH